MAEPARPFTPAVLVLDFDGTMTTDDIGDRVCDRFAPRAWLEIDQAWVRGELSLQEAQRRMWALCRCQRDEAVGYARHVGRLRPGLDAFLDRAAQAGVPVWLASGGFDFYIEALLGEERLGRLARRSYNRARFAGHQVQVEFPHEDLACARCAVCKGRVCALARAAHGAPVVFIGDGHSDRCVLDHGPADRLCAVAGSALDRIAAGAGAPCLRFTDFFQLAERLLPC